MYIDEVGKTYAYNFGQLGCPVQFVRAVESPLGDTFYFNLENIRQYNKVFISKLMEKLGAFHHDNLSFVETRETHFAMFCRKSQSSISLSQLLNDREIVIGKDINGRNTTIDFNKAPHLLIAGTTGSGKSVLIHNLLVNILNHYGNKQQLVLIDPKGTELPMYRNVRNATFVGGDTTKSISVLQQCEKIMDDRYRNGGYYFHEIFIVIDELADLMLTSHYEVEQSIVRIAQKGRAVGMHIIVATQRPTVNVVSGLISANIENRIALKVASVRNSVIILDHKGAEDMRGKGECIAKINGEETRTQIAYCESSLESNIINFNRG